MMRNDILDRKIEIQLWINENKPKGFIAKELNCKQCTLNSYLLKMGITYAGNQGGVGTNKNSHLKISALDYLNSNNYIKSSKLRKKLIDDGLKEWKCEDCKLTEWMGVKIPLELHHIDGNHHNNMLDNLKILCPNCHTLTPNYGTKNKNVGVLER